MSRRRWCRCSTISRCPRCTRSFWSRLSCSSRSGATTAACSGRSRSCFCSTCRTGRACAPWSSSARRWSHCSGGRCRARSCPRCSLRWSAIVVTAKTAYYPFDDRLYNISDTIAVFTTPVVVMGALAALAVLWLAADRQPRDAAHPVALDRMFVYAAAIVVTAAVQIPTWGMLFDAFQLSTQYPIGRSCARHGGVLHDRGAARHALPRRRERSGPAQRRRMPRRASAPDHDRRGPQYRLRPIERGRARLVQPSSACGLAASHAHHDAR